MYYIYMLTDREIDLLLPEFPEIKLSYENITHNKVFNAEITIAIPEGTKCFAWFTHYKNKNVCLIMELNAKKNIISVKRVPCCFRSDISYGTIFYGTIFIYAQTTFFTMEDIFYYKGQNMSHQTWIDKFVLFTQIMKHDIKQVAYNDSFIVFGMPLYSDKVEDIENKVKSKVIFFDITKGLNSNQSAVFCVGKILGINKELMFKVFSEFKGIQDRMEELDQINNIRFINDSKATTADSAIWAIKNINTPIILIAGGRHKGIDYQVILEAARGKVKQVILIGEAKEKIASDLGGEFPIEMAFSLEDAVNKAYVCALPGYSILFSPMCSSFDMFIDYQDRGRVFKKIVSELALKINSHG